MIETERLILRLPVAADHAPLHAMWSDPSVMADLGPLKTPEDSAATIARHEAYRAAHGVGFWTVARRADGAVIGYCGLKPGAEDTPIAGELEIGWMLTASAWGHGYAQEAARASLAWGWANRAEPRIVAITAAQNRASLRVMERLGMTPLGAGSFIHPKFAADDPRRITVAYAIARPA